MTLQREYGRDPLEILIEREERSCTGCKHERKEKMFGVIIMTCKKDRKHGKKCTHYKEKE